MDLEKIITVLCESEQIERDALYCKTRDRKIWYARYILWYYLHYNYGLSANTLAKMSNRARLTIFRGIRILKDQMPIYKDLRDRYEVFVEKLEGASYDTPSENMD